MALPWLVLGDVVFSVLDAPEEFTSKFAQDYAEHAVIEDAPRLQWIGRKLREITFRLKLHHLVNGEPELRIRELVDTADNHEPLDLVMGSGQVGTPFVGRYVITELSPIVKAQADDGRILWAEMDVTLREWVEDQVLETSRLSPKTATGKGKKTTAKTETVTTTPKTRGNYSMPDITRQPGR